MDIWDKKKRSDVMAKIRSKDTKPEWIVRRYLYSRGYRYRKNVKGLPGTPDIVLRKYGIVIFIHGCFWHGHEVDGHIPHSNVDFWRKKIERNKQRKHPIKYPFSLLYFHCTFAFAILHELLTYFHYDTRTI